jgi:hypothetical protein
MTALPPARRRLFGTVLGGVKWVALLALAGIAVLLLGVLVAELLAGGAPSATWHRYADVGETFGAINSVFSGLALAALVITFWVQFHELRTQRTELAMQREALSKSQEALHRTAEANLRMLHVELLKMGIDDPDLAAVWPPLKPGLPHEINRQYFYANLIFQNVRLYLTVGSYSTAHIEANLRYLFSSPLMRDYWKASAFGRSFVPPDTLEAELAALADSICTEYDTVMANGHGRAHGHATTTPRERPDANPGVAA